MIEVEEILEIGVFYHTIAEKAKDLEVYVLVFVGFDVGNTEILMTQI